MLFNDPAVIAELDPSAVSFEQFRDNFNDVLELVKVKCGQHRLSFPPLLLVNLRLECHYVVYDLLVMFLENLPRPSLLDISFKIFQLIGGAGVEIFLEGDMYESWKRNFSNEVLSKCTEKILTYYRSFPFHGSMCVKNCFTWTTIFHIDILCKCAWRHT